jgi:hypothetical protein
MNCGEVREQWTELIYGECGPAIKAALQEHLAGCPTCRREYAGLRQLLSRLDSVPAPDVQVDLPALYRQAAAEAKHRGRRWRRLALGASAAAALLALVAIGLRVEARLEPNQLVLRWGSFPRAEALSPAKAADSPPADQANQPSAASFVEELQLHSQLIHALADGFQDLERQGRRNADQVQARLQAMQQQNSQRWLAIHRTLDALYTLSQKGE